MQLVRPLLLLFALCPFSATAWEFEAIPVPRSDAEKRHIQTTSSVTMHGKKYPITFRTLLRSGDKLNETLFGGLRDARQRPVYGSDGKPRVSNYADFTSLLQADGELFMVSQFESRPAGIFLSRLQQNPQTGELKPLDLQSLDLSEIRGAWGLCAGTLSPWNSHLAGEEYEPDAARWDSFEGLPDFKYTGMAAYYDDDLSRLNPYDYGWIIEVKLLKAKAGTAVQKQYALGRFSHETAYVMPDHKTVYLPDDGVNSGFFMFIADKAGDLSAGNLYAAQWQQTGDKHGGSAKIAWISLAHLESRQVAAWLRDKLRFNDIFDKQEPNKQGQCPAGYTSVNNGGDKRPKGVLYHECLRLKTGMETAAAALETRRYAALRKATTEFNKVEGVVYDPRRQRLYLSVSSVNQGMLGQACTDKCDSPYDEGGWNHIRLPVNYCGMVYALDVKADEKTAGAYTADKIYPLLNGKMTQAYGEGGDIPAYTGELTNNHCSLEHIAGPDNLAFAPQHDILFIAEDSDKGHENNALWAYHVGKNKLTRIQTAVYGAEITSTGIYEINGFTYLTSVIQHPFRGKYKELLKKPEEAAAYTGYIGIFP